MWSPRHDNPHVEDLEIKVSHFAEEWYLVVISTNEVMGILKRSMGEIFPM